MYDERVSVDPQLSKYCFIETNPDMSVSGFGVALVGFDKTLPEYSIDRSDFECVGLEYVVEGEGSVVLGGQTYPLRRQSFFIYGPGMPHAISNDPDRPMSKFFVDFYGDEAVRALSALGLKVGMHFESALDNRLPVLFEGLLKDAERGIGAMSTLELSVRLILSVLANESQREVLQTDHAYQSYLRCRDYIEARYTDAGNVADFAADLNISSAYLSRLFKRYSKETPYQLLLRMRMTYAGNLLVATRQSVQQVADASGFQDPFHFSHRFKQYFGVSPRAFKQRYQR
ncbi:MULTISPECIES: AraC family transcriptional regulator [unclassified Lentimonas]|uniref:AraC family transcriptional regulator n=1 Tax=unclassified Lentimonas TaxID=2630993 RepID=UPI001389F777|nr:MULTISPECIES: AraC family transcriptional regulator [unclassified Lentimonas]